MTPHEKYAHQIEGPFALPEHSLRICVIIGVCYLFTIGALRNLKAPRFLNLKLVMCVYNMIMSAWSLYMFLGFLGPFISNWKSAGYKLSLLIQDPELKLSQNMQWMILMFYWSKYVEYLDTLWTILLGKLTLNPRCFLQIYHHWITPAIVFCSLYYPFDMTWMGPLTNTFVHVVMYSYYAGSYFFKNKSFRKLGNYIFVIQMTQFFSCVFIMLAVCFLKYQNSGSMPQENRYSLYFVSSQYFTFIAMFAIFKAFRNKEIAKDVKKKN